MGLRKRRCWGCGGGLIAASAKMQSDDKDAGLSSEAAKTDKDARESARRRTCRLTG